MLRKALRKARFIALQSRRRLARRAVALLHRSARENRSTPIAVRLVLAVYFVKRTLQEAVIRHWPMTKLRRRRWISEVVTAFTGKLLHWAHDRFDLPADAHHLNRVNNRVNEADCQAMTAAALNWNDRPLVSILVPVYNAKQEWIERLASSVLDQVYDRWELVLIDDASPNEDVWLLLRQWAERDSRIVVERMAVNGGVAAATNRAAELASGEFLAFADHDDELAPEALWCMVEAIQNADEVDLVYSDEEIVPAGASPHPMFKPGWSPELLVSYNYVCHFVMLRRTAFDAVGGLRLGFDGAQDHDLLLRLSDKVRNVVHVPRLLYRWHAGSDSMSRRVEQSTGGMTAAEGIADKTRRAVQEHLDRKRLHADAEIVQNWCLPRYRPVQRGKASIVICTKDNAICLRAAVQSIESKTDYPDYELLIVDTGAESAEAMALLDELSTRHRVLKYDGGGERFNWSRVNNRAVEQAKGDVVVLLNDDVEVVEPGWLSALVTMATQPKVGAVGALLEYPDGRIQHAGVIVGAHGWGPWHVMMGWRVKQPTDYQGIAHFQRNCLAVTGACLAIRRELFREMGGLDDANLAVGFSDVDLCLRLHRAGFRNVYAPQARLIHKEGQSRGLRIDVSEAATLASRTDGIVDPYWNPHFTRESHIPGASSRRRAFGLRFSEGVRALTVFGGEGEEYGPPVNTDFVEFILPTEETTPLSPCGRGVGGEGYDRQSAAEWTLGTPHRLASSPPPPQGGRIFSEPRSGIGGAAVGDVSRQEVAQTLTEDPFDVLIAVGWDAASAVKAAAEIGVPSIWHLSQRPMVEGRFDPNSFQQFARRWRTQNLAYQVVFADVHTRSCWQQGWPRPNSMVIERVVPRMRLEEIETARTAARKELPEGSFVVAVDDDPDVQRCLGEVIERLDESLRKRILVANDPAAADAFVCQPFGQHRGLGPLTALAHGVPMIGSRFLEHADLMHVGVTGLEVPELDPAALAKALQELFENEDRRREMSRQSLAWLASRASCRWVEGEWRRLLEEAAELKKAVALADSPAKAVRSGWAELKGIPTTFANDRS